MLKDSHAFSGFSVDDLSTAKEFYNKKLGLEIKEDEMGLTLKANGSNGIFIYQKDDHTPATYTILNFPVENIDTTVDDLNKNGIKFEQYKNEFIKTDSKGIARGSKSGFGPDIAWFRDPAGNILSVLTIDVKTQSK